MGIDYVGIGFAQQATSGEILSRIRELNDDGEVHGILVGMPTFSHVEGEELIAEIVRNKDIDGLGPDNSYFLYSNQEHLGIAPATAVATIHILESRTSLKGKSVALIGRGRTVGRPVAAMLINRDATVTVCHSRTPADALERTMREAEIVVSATGAPGSVEEALFRPGQTAIDCGISFVNGKTTGDLNGAALSSRGIFVTPVPKGVGLVTNSIIFGNLLRAVSLDRDEGTNHVA